MNNIIKIMTMFVFTFLIPENDSPPYADTAIKLGYCAYGGWSVNTGSWYQKHAKLIIMGEDKVKDMGNIKRYDKSILIFLYKTSLNKENKDHGVAGYDWINKKHGGWIMKVKPNKPNKGTGKLYNNTGERAHFLNTRTTLCERTFFIEINTPGNVGEATFSWGIDGNEMWKGNDILTSVNKINLIDGIKIWFSESDYKKGDRWSFVVQDCWFLLDKNGLLMTDQYSEHSKKNVFWMDWGNPAWQLFWAKDVVKDLKWGGWDGVMSDYSLVNIRTYWAPNGVLQYETDMAFNAAIENFYTSVYKIFRSSKKMFLPNLCEAIDNWNRRIEYTDGGLDEGFINVFHYSKELIWRSEEQWAKQIHNLEETCEKGKIYFAMSHNRGLNRQDLLFNLASFLLGTDGKHGYFCNINSLEYNIDNYIRDYEEFKDIYEIPIGKPAGEKYYEDGVWKRNYTNGLVVANPSSIEKEVFINKCYLTLEGCALDSINLPPHAGLLLIRNASFPNSCIRTMED